MHGATLEAESLGLADDHGVRSTLSVVHARPLFAGEIATITDKWRVVEGGFAVWSWSQHDHMGVDGGDAEENCGGDGSERRFGGGHAVRGLRFGRF